jgi:hypothetical protein
MDLLYPFVLNNAVMLKRISDWEKLKLRGNTATEILMLPEINMFDKVGAEQQ